MQIPLRDRGSKARSAGDVKAVGRCECREPADRHAAAAVYGKCCLPVDLGSQGVVTGRRVDVKLAIRRVGADADTATCADQELIDAGRCERGIGIVGPHKSAILLSLGPTAGSKTNKAIGVVVCPPGHKTHETSSLIAYTTNGCAGRAGGGVTVTTARKAPRGAGCIAHSATDNAVFSACDIVTSPTHKASQTTGGVILATADKTAVLTGGIRRAASDKAVYGTGGVAHADADKAARPTSRVQRATSDKTVKTTGDIA